MLNKKHAERLGELLRKEGIDVVIVGPSVDLYYLTGFNVHVCERFQAFFFQSDGKYYHISPQLYFEEAQTNLGQDTDIFMWKDSENFLDAIEAVNQKYGLEGKTIAINSAIRGIDLIDIQTKLKADFVNGNDLMETLRVRKDESEVEKLRKAAHIADEVVGEVIEYIKPGMTEKDIKEKIEELFTQKGVCMAFNPIVASGPNSSMPHYCDDSRVIQEKDIIIMDLGCQYEDYCSDISRTVFVGGITEEEKKIYNIVLEANKTAEEKVKNGVTAEDVDKAARDVITREGYGENFLNRTGHGIGISVHEAPYIRTGNRQILEKGMSFSVEPGIYIPGKFGIRIEDIVVVGDKGADILNRFSKEIIVI